MDVENLAKELILKNMTPEQQMAVLDSVRQSVANAKEVQKKKIGENVDLVVQALKKIESDIRDRFDAVGNSIEKRVLSIQDGRDGADGKDGRDGKDGKSGKDGLKGDRGVDGQAGRDGVDGVDGISVVNAQIDFDGSLVITLSDGRELNVGEVVSQDIAEKIKVISTMSTNGAVGIKDEGTSISTGVKTINFVGAAVTATNSGDDVTVNVSSGTGTVTSVAATVPAFLSVSGSPITTTGTLAISLSGTALPIANGGTGNATGTATINANLTGDVTSVGNASTLATVNTNVGSFTNASLTVNGKGLITAASSGTTPVTSVAGTSPVASSGGTTPAISLEANYGDTLNPYASKTAKFVLAAPNASAGVPTFRAIVASDIPTLNQSTTGSAATLTTTRAIYGNNFDGSAALTQIIASTYGGTGNGFTKFTGATTAEKTYTLPNASSTIVVQGGALGTPSSGTLTNCTFPTLNQNTTGSAATVTTTINSGVVATTQSAGDNSTKVATTAYVNAITGTSGIAGLKNRIINGAMVIDQRNAGASQTFTAAAALAYSVDRWYGYCTGANVTGQQVAGSTTPTNTQFRYKFTGAASVTAVGFGQRIEQKNSFDLAGSTCTLSADLAISATLTTVTWTASYATTTADTFGTLASPTVTQIATGTFTVTSTVTNFSANISVPAAATTGIQILFTVGALTAGLTWTIGNVQFEKGSTATSFDYRPYGTELQLCQRYYEKSFDMGTAVAQNSGTYNGTAVAPSPGALSGMAFGDTRYKVNKRNAASVTFYNPAAANAFARDQNAGVNCTATSAWVAGESSFAIAASTPAGSGVTNRIAVHWSADSEL